MSHMKRAKLSQNNTYHNHGFVENFEKLYLDAKSSDINFLFGSDDGTSADTDSGVVAHKSVLAATSDVLYAMFYGELKENGDIRITDSSKGAFVEFLQFFYLTEVELTEKNIAAVMDLGHKYNVAHCFDVCVQFLKDILTTENFLAILDLATTYDQHELIKLCKKFIILDTAAVLKSNGFLECDKKAVAHIMKMDILSCSEVELFEACMSWVKAKIGQDVVVSREMVDMHLGELFYQIRFASMTMKDLCTLADKYDLVLQKNFMTISKMITIPEYQSKEFNTLPRQIKWNADAAIECSFKNGNDFDYFLHKTEHMLFSTSEPFLLGGFTCSKIVQNKKENGKYLNLSQDLSVDVDVFETDDLDKANGNVLLKMKANLQSADTKVILSRPVLIRPGFFYKVSLGPFPDDHVHHSEVLKEEMQIPPNITIKLHKCLVNANPENVSCYEKPMGLIWALDFNNI